MQSFNLVTAVDKNKLASDKAFLAAMKIDIKDHEGQTVEVLRLVNDSVDFVFEGITYSSYPFSVELKYGLGQQPELSVSAMDATRTLMQRMELYSGGVGSIVTFMWIHEDNTSGPADISEIFEIVSASAKDYVVSFNLGSANMTDIVVPARRQLTRCSWVFKDVNCAYAGPATTCDYSLTGADGCVSKANSINFGGFPGLKNAQIRNY